MTTQIFKAIVLAATATAAGFLAIARAAVDSGKPAPDFTCTDISGQTHRLSDYRGRIVVLEWLSPGCPFVLRHYRSGNMPDTQAMAAAQGAVWLQVNSSAMGDLDPAKTSEWQKKQGAVAHAYVRDQDGQLGRLFGAQTTPHLFVIARDGTLAYQGAIDDQPNASLAGTTAAHNYVKAALTALKAGQPVEKANTPPYGCGLKFGAER
jgi:peroxiredoxin